MQIRILIFGASGFIAKALSSHLKDLGYEVIHFSRRSIHKTEKVIYWELSCIPQEFELKKNDIAIHLAHDFDKKDGASRTLNGTKSLIDYLYSKKIARQYFFSSYSAGEHSQSIYGKTKFEIEKHIHKLNNCVIVRPGLVIGNGGIFKRIVDFSLKFPFIVIPRAKTPYIDIEKLCVITSESIKKRAVSKEINAFEPSLEYLSSLIRTESIKNGKNVLILELCPDIILWTLKFLETIKINLPFNSDNLIGFIHNQSATHESSLK